MSAPAREPRCGMCRYPVRGLPTFRCPECGNDFRKVGITATGVRSHLTPRRRIGYWTLLFVVAAIPVLALADNLVRWRQSNTAISMRDPAGRDVTLTVTEQGYAGPLLRRNVLVSITSPQGKQALLAIDGKTLAYHFPQGSGERGSQVNAEVLMKCFGVPDADGTLRLQALDLLAMVKAAIADGDLRHRPPVYFEQRAFRYTGSGGGVSLLPVLGLLLLAWGIGAWIVARRTSVEAGR